MFTLNCKGKLVVADKPLVMGIINTSADSFYPASSMPTIESVLQQAEKMIREGADILDIGGQSTRPGSLAVSEEAELNSVLPAIDAIIKNFPGTILSIDTYRSKVAKASIEAGGSMINDISAGNMDPDMISAAASLQVPYICMHMKGIPETMQQEPYYENVTKEILDFFIKKTEVCISAGMHDVIIDPGFGFGKSISHNFQLLKNLSTFKILGKPILAGISRKSTIYKTLGISVNDSLNGTTVLHTLALQNGADILRVHDVKEAKEAITLFMAYTRAGGYV
jgi:dihydropteroate synthase